MSVESPFQIVRRGLMADFKKMVNNTNVGLLNEEGQNLLHEAIAFKRDDFSEYLLSLGIDVNHQDNNGQTPLHFASAHSNKYIVDLLFKAGANPTIRDKYGNDPLWTATFNARGNYAIVRLFEKKGANPLNKNNAGRTTLDFARQINDSKLLKLLAELMV